jgi:hypothetical protein
MRNKFFGAIATVETLAFSLLFGSMATLGLMVAPILFRMVTSRDLAGRVFGNILSLWFWVALVCTLSLVATAIFAFAMVKENRRILGARLAVLVPMTAIVVWFGFVMGRMSQIQASLTRPIEEYSLTENPRLEFDGLHKLSTQLMTWNLGLSLIWFGLTIWALMAYVKRARAAKIADAPQIEREVVAAR